MLWHTEPSSFDFSTVYRSGPFRIRHYTERDAHGRGTLGFGMSLRAYIATACS